MQKIFTISFLTRKEIGSHFPKHNFKKHLAIQNGSCIRCGEQNLTEFCTNCNEFGVLNATDYLYNLNDSFLNTQKIKIVGNTKMTPLQLKASSFINETKGDVLIWAVCGAGKTEIVFNSIFLAIKKGETVCFAIPRIDILYEISQRLACYFSGIKIAVINSKEQKLVDADIYVITTNQVIKFKKAFGLIIVDEVDAFPYEHNHKFDYGVQTSKVKTGKVVYLTATPSKFLLSKKLETFKIYKRWHNKPLPIPKLVYFPIKFKYTSHIIKFFTRGSKRQLLIFVANKKLAENLSKKLKSNKIDYVHSSKNNRRETIEQFRKKNIDILITTPILERGVTFEDIDVIVLDSSSKLYTCSSLVQIAGRVGRFKEFQRGCVYFIHQGITDDIINSREQIIEMNNLLNKEL